MTFTTPCARPENDPNDWFIERDGRQYVDEPLLSEDEIQAIMAEHDSKLFGEMQEIIADATDERLAERLVARRHAKDKCFTECIFRMHCLSLADNEDHGTWGGYYTEERRQIEKLRAEKAAERAVRARG